MVQTLDSKVVEEKNQWHSSYPWLLLAKVYLPDGTIMRKVHNPEDVYFGEEDHVAAGCIAHWRMNDNDANTTVADSGPNGYDGTLNGGNNTVDISSSGKVNTALELDGTLDFINCGDVCDAGTEDFEICGWIQTTSGGVIVSKGTVGDGTNHYYLLVNSSTGKVETGIGGSGAARKTAVSTTVVNDGGWHWIGASWDRDGNLQLLIDNVEDNYVDISAESQSLDNAENFCIGRYSNSASGYFDGRLDDIRIYDKVLAKKARNLIFNAYEISGCVGYWTLDESDPNTTVGDDSDYGNDGVLQGGRNTEDLSVNGKVKNAFDLNGTADYIEVTDSESLNPQDKVSVGGWFDPDNTANRAGMIGKPDNYILIQESNYIKWIVYDGTASTSIAQFAVADLVAGFNHVFGTFDGSQARIYLNGTLKDTGSSISGIRNNAGNLLIGKSTDASEFYDGRIDDVRIYNRQLTQNHIAEIYNGGIGNPIHPKASVGNGTEYQPVKYEKCYFDVDPVKMSGQEQIPSTRLYLSNVSRFLKPFLDDYDLTDGNTVVELIVVNYKYMTGDYVELINSFEVKDYEIDARIAAFVLGPPGMLTAMVQTIQYDSQHCSHKVFECAECGYTRKTVAGVTLAGTNPVSIQVTAHNFDTTKDQDYIRLADIAGITPSLDGSYKITITDANNFTLNGTDSSNFSGTYTSGGTAGYHSCQHTLGDCRTRENSDSWGAEKGLTPGTITIV
jgi:hypothetical protein